MYYYSSASELFKLELYPLGLIELEIVGSMERLAGAAGGMRFSRSFSVENAAQDYYDSAYSVGEAVDINEVVIEDILLKDSIWVVLCCSLSITAAGTVIALASMNRSLKREPMQILCREAEGEL